MVKINKWREGIESLEGSYLKPLSLFINKKANLK